MRPAPLARTLVLALALMTALAAWSTSARHNRLTHSLPAADTTMASPAEIRLSFSEPPEPRLSAISLLASDSSRVALGPVRATTDPRTVSAAVPTPLAPGRYAVVWRTTSTDGHAVRGRFVFTVRN